MSSAELSVTNPKPVEPLLKRRLMRPLSHRLTRLFGHHGVPPQVVLALAFGLTGLAAWLASLADYGALAWAAIAFVGGTLFSMSAQELLRKQPDAQTRIWRWRLLDNLRYALFYTALGIGAYKGYGGSIYLWAVPMFVLVYAFAVVTFLGFIRRQPRDVRQLFYSSAHAWGQRRHPLRARFHTFAAFWVEQDMHALAAAVLCLVGLPHIVFWLACAGLAVATVRIVRGSLAGQINETAEQQRNYVPLILYTVGAVILIVLIQQMPLDAVGKALDNIGWSVFWVFAAAPLYMFADTLSLSNLVHHRVKLGELFYIWVVGEAYNAVVPMVGLAGEPIKARELAYRLPVEDASKAIVRNKLIHMLSGPVYTAAIGALALSLVSFDPQLRSMLVTVCIGLAILGTAMIAVTLSPAPTKFTNFVLKRLKLVQAGAVDRLSNKRFTISLFYKLLGRAMNLIELYLIFRLLGLQPSVADLAAVSAVVMAAAVIFFMVPQGLGVAELGITGAFTALGYPAHIGLAFGLVRRARLVIWGLGGLGLHLLVTAWRAQPGPQTQTPQYVRGRVRRV